MSNIYSLFLIINLCLLYVWDNYKEYIYKKDFSLFVSVIFVVNINLLMLLFIKVPFFDFLFPAFIRDDLMRLVSVMVLSIFNNIYLYNVTSSDNTIVCNGIKTRLKNKYSLILIKRMPKIRFSLIFVSLNMVVVPIFILNWDILINEDLFLLTTVPIEKYKNFSMLMTSIALIFYILAMSFFMAISYFLVRLFHEIVSLSGFVKYKYRLSHYLQSIIIFILSLIYFLISYKFAIRHFEDFSFVLEKSSYSQLPSRCNNIKNLDTGYTAKEEGFDKVLFIDGSNVSLMKKENNTYTFAIGYCSSTMNNGSYQIIK